MRTISLACLASLLLAVCAAGSVHADRPVELGGFVGAHWFNGSNELGLRDEATDDLALNPAVEFGVRMGVSLCPCLLVEGELSLTPTSTRARRRRPRHRLASSGRVAVPPAHSPALRALRPYSAPALSRHHLPMRGS